MSLMSLIGRGFNAKTVMDMLIRKYPEHKGKIQAATAAGFSYNTIAKALDGKSGGNAESYMTEHERAVKSHSDNRKRAAMGVVSALGVAGAAAAGGYAYATRNRAVQPSAILPPLPGQGPQPRGPQGRGGGPQQGQTINITPGQGGGGTGNVPALANQQGLIPYSPPRSVAPVSMPSGPIIIPPYEHDPQKNVSFVKNIREDKRIGDALASGLSIPAVAQYIRETLPKGKVTLMEKAPGGLEQVLEDFNAHRRSINSEDTRINMLQQARERQAQGMQQPQGLREREFERFQRGYGTQDLREQAMQPTVQEMIPGHDEGMDTQAVQAQQPMMQPQAQQVQQEPQFRQQEQGLEPIDQKTPEEMMQDQTDQLVQDIKDPLVEEIEDLKKEQKKDRLAGIDVPSILNNMVMTPDGAVEVKHRGTKGIIGQLDNGQQKSFNNEDVEAAPEDFEDAVRQLVNMIPETEKSTSFQTAIRVPLPNDKSVTLIKFYDGKIAWYLDVPEQVYRDVAMGSYTPKGQGKTGIAEYNPSVMDSRGAGFHQEIKTNPLYNSENKGVTWGYADNAYDALAKTQPILKKISRERKDENGNVITPKPRKRKPN